MKGSRIERIREALAVLQPISLEIKDDSQAHAGHAGARDGRGHFSVRLVSAQFQGLSALKRHKCVYAALADMLESDIHALAIRAISPDEISSQ